MMNPVVRLRLAHIERQSMHRVQRVGLLVDQNAQQFVSTPLQRPLGATADTALALFAFIRAITGIIFFVSDLKGLEELRKLFQRSPGRREKIAGSVFQRVIV